MTAQISGTRDGKDWPAPGGTVDVDADEARDLIGAGMAVESADQPADKVESATVDNTPVKRTVTPPKFKS